MGRARDRASADLNGQEFILDADADTSISADTDDQIDIKIAGADDFQFTANTFTVKSGSTIVVDDTTDSTSTTTGSIQTDGGVGIAKDLVVGDDILLKSDDGAIQFGADSDVTITHDPDDGLILKSTATSDDNPFLLTLQTGETDLAANDVIGKIAFQAPDEGTGTDAILVSGAIQARAEGDHSSSSNATSLDFMTGASEAATTKMSVNSLGQVLIGTTTGAEYTNRLFTIGDTSIASSFAEIRTSTSGTGHVLFSDSSGQNTGNYAGYIAYAHASDSMTFHTGGGTEAMKIDSNGIITSSKQPASIAYNNANNSQAFSSADTYEIVQFNIETIDKNADYASSQTFTAPVDGTYYANANILRTATSSGSISYDLAIYVNSTLTLYARHHGDNSGTNTSTQNVTGLLDLDASDTVQVYARVSDTKGQRYQSQTSTYFHVFLLG